MSVHGCIHMAAEQTGETNGKAGGRLGQAPAKNNVSVACDNRAG